VREGSSENFQCLRDEVENVLTFLVVRKVDTKMCFTERVFIVASDPAQKHLP
jgi:hypothetical protein